MAADGARSWILTGSPENCKPVFQGQLRTVSDADAGWLMERMRAAAGASA